MAKNATPSDQNKKTWSSNLVQFDKAKTSRKYSIVEDLSHMHKIPTEQQIVDRYKSLAALVKNKKKRIVLITSEVKQLWKNLNLPIQRGKSTVTRKIENVISKLEKNKRRPGSCDFTNLFNITDEKGEWLCQEDKDFYKVQLSTKGKVGYSTSKEDVKNVHPRKLKMLKQKTSVAEHGIKTSNEESSEGNESMSEDEGQFSSGSEVNEKPTTSKRQKTDTAVSLVTKAKLSTRKAHKVCETLFESGVCIPTPTQSGVYKAVMKEGEKVREQFKRNLKQEQWCLHFDGKTIEKKEYQVVVLKNEHREVRLAVLELINGKGETIFTGIKAILDEYELWNSIKLIITDTTAANTGQSRGAVTRLQNHFADIGLPKPLFIGCQHHILDTILKHALNDFFGESSTSPNISYSFVSKINQEYEILKSLFNNNGGLLPKGQPIKWRDDMAFLHHLISCYRYFQRTGSFPQINFQSLPALSNARWNSRAIYALLAYILLPDYRERTRLACDFITGSWADIWFSAQSFNPDDFDNLSEVCKQHPKALKSLKKFWSKDPTPIPTQRSNICAERAIKVMQDLLPLCRSTEKLNIKFLLTN